MKSRLAGCLGLVLGIATTVVPSRADTRTGMAGTFGSRGAVTRVRQGAGPTFSVVLQRRFDGCTGDLSGVGRAVADHAVTMSVRNPGDGTTCTVDLVYAPNFNAVTLKESAACLTWHGMACNFEGTFRRAR